MSNSLRFTPQGGKILIQAVILFYQGDKPRNSGKHYGIGIYVVDYLVKKMNGSMNLYRVKLGGAGVRIVIVVRD